MYRVNWLRAKSRRDRWAEEVQILSCEMRWTMLFHRHRKELWLSRARAVETHHPLQVFYARKQAYNWSLLESQAEKALSAIKP